MHEAPARTFPGSLRKGLTTQRCHQNQSSSWTAESLGNKDIKADCDSGVPWKPFVPIN